MAKFCDQFYPETRFGGFSDIDGTIVFYSRVNALLEPSFIVLDVGCGRGASQDDAVAWRRNLRVLRGKAAMVVGIDVDPGAAGNGALDEFRLISGATWPVDDHAVDMIICDNVLEHMDEPAVFFREARRVLKGGGGLCIRTPNRWSYVALAARVLPQKYHRRVLAWAQEGRAAEDVFPTYYRCNTIPQLRMRLRDAGFEAVVYGYEAEPSYLSFSRFAYRLGIFHQRFAPGWIRAAIFAFAQAPEKSA